VGTHTITRAREPTCTDLADEVPQHLLCRFEVGYHTVAKGTASSDMRWGSSDHLTRLLSDRLHPARQLVDRDDRGLEEHDALATAENDRVRRTQIDC
jgi:hypothetical protein